ncbi:plant intracellular Ras-group-related LRR protein 5-like isoform X3 [Venturia canescens]|uniref:plant intracellular Ras-group-related LRR protein 5-like isoform X3 n=1 Tax=Venturia canescens TaxID=32260 RepID=UPI001C9D02B5|nr:plant intracellular Ras-group-related LRR protein 5-like isoform X3 [Venturia canescens]
MEGEWPLNYPLDYAFANEDEIPKYVEMSVPTKVCSLEEHHVSKLLSNINYNTVRDLVLSAKKLNDLPEDFGFHLVNLTRLDLSKNDLTTLDKLLGLLKELAVLKAANRKKVKRCNDYWHLPTEQLEFPEKMVEMDLSFTKLSYISENIEHFVNLVELDLHDNALRWLPDEICKLPELKILNVADNSLLGLPNDFGNLSSLTEFQASKNKIPALPHSTKKLKNLAYLDLYGNAFTRVPKTLKFMVKLQGLDIDYNPVFISNLQINGIRYETLRKTLHKKYLHLGCWRDSGARYDTDYDETSETDSEISTTDSHEYHTGATEKLNNKIEENWDISDNSADEYDPTCDQGYPTRKRLPNFYYGVAHNLYCPSALHALPIRQQIIQLKEQGLFQEYAETEVEGQFEDA